MGDRVIRSVWTDLVTNWYTNYTIEYVPDAGHFIMREKSELINERLKKAFLGWLELSYINPESCVKIIVY
jgi:pimeloyl-ACP methyl ester carboxylesterase